MDLVPHNCAARPHRSSEADSPGQRRRLGRPGPVGMHPTARATPHPATPHPATPHPAGSRTAGSRTAAGAAA